MKYFKVEEYTNEDFLRAKAVCDGTSTDIAFFNTCFIDLREYISERFSIREDPSENPLDKLGKEIIRDFKIMMYIDSEMTETSIDEFILKSLQDWNPNIASYLKYVYNLLVNWHARVPVNRTTDQQANLYQLKYFTRVVKSAHPELEIDNLPFNEKLKTLDHYLPKEYKNKFYNVSSMLQTSTSLDVSLSQDEDSATFLDMVESSYSSDDEIPVSKTNPFSIIDKTYAQFKKAKLQKRMAEKINLYLTVQLIEATVGYLSFEDFKELSTKYPDFIRDVDWIEQIFLDNTKEHPDYRISTRLPSQIQQAEHLKMDYHSYCNSIMRYKEKIETRES